MEMKALGQLGQPLQDGTQPRLRNARLHVVVHQLGAAVIGLPDVAQNFGPRHEILAAGQRQSVFQVLPPPGGDLVGLGLRDFIQLQELLQIGVAD